MDWTLPILVILIGTVGFVLGASISYATTRIPFLTPPLVYTFSGGIIMGLLLLELLPEAWEGSPWYYLLVGLLIGFGFLSLFGRISRKLVLFHSNHQIETFLLFCIAISIHNIPLGITLGSMEYLSIPLLIALAFHHIPEGIALFSPLIHQHFRTRLILWTSFLLSLSLGLGSFLGGWFPKSNSSLLAVLMGISIAILCHITFSELLHKGYRELSKGKWIVGTLAGVGFCYLFLQLLPVHHH